MPESPTHHPLSNRRNGSGAILQEHDHCWLPSPLLAQRAGNYPSSTSRSIVAKHAISWCVATRFLSILCFSIWLRVPKAPTVRLDERGPVAPHTRRHLVQAEQGLG